MNRTRAAAERMAGQPVPSDGDLRRAVLDNEPDRLLDEVLGGPRSSVVPGRGPGHRRWRPVAVVAVSVAAVLAAVAVFLLPRAVDVQPLPHVTDPATGIDPAEVLNRLADLAAARPPLPDEPFDYVHTVGWGPTFDDQGRPVPVEQAERTERESWVDAAGLGRSRHTTGDGTVESDLDLLNQDPPVPLLTDLPTDPAALAAALEDALAAARSNQQAVPHSSDIMIWTWYHQVVDPQVQAAFLRLLASGDGVRVLGPGTDRLGRDGVVVSLTREVPAPGNAPAGTSTVVTRTLVLDPRTGAPLGDELTRTVDGRVTLHSATAWISTGRVGSVDERP